METSDRPSGSIPADGDAEASAGEEGRVLQIGAHRLPPVRADLPVMTLAPMAGVNNRAFRMLCARLGARLVGTEFINCRDVEADLRRRRRLLDYADADTYRRAGTSLLAGQIYGNDAALIAAGAQRLEALGAQVLDINFGCSVPRIMAKGSGAAYLRDLDALSEAVRRTVAAVAIPVTVKTRLGWDEDSINVLEVVRRAEAAGARAVAIHARTVAQRYRGAADWSWIARAREVASGPILGNGDVRSVADAVAMQCQTGCDAVMIGRAAMANPRIFAGRDDATLDQLVDLAVEHLEAMTVLRGERAGVLQTRKHLALYFRHLGRDSEDRRRLLTTGSLAEVVDLLQAWRRRPDLAPPATLALSGREADRLSWSGRS